MASPVAPLAGIRIANTRPLLQAGELTERLQEAGAAVVVAPLISIAPPADLAPLRAAAENVATFDWLVFSSVNGVAGFMAACTENGTNSTELRNIEVACVGPATADAARAHGLHVTVMPDEYVGDAIADALTARDSMAGKRILLARAGGARLVLPERLRAAGARVTDIEVYRSIPDPSGAAVLKRAIADGAVDAVALTSGSAVRYFAEAVGSPGKAVLAVIGPVSAEAARAHGYDLAVEAAPHTTAGLVAGLADYFGRKRKSLENA